MSNFQYITTKHDAEKRLWIRLWAHDTLSPQATPLLKELGAALNAAAQDTALQGIIIVTGIKQSNAQQPATRPATFKSLASLQPLTITLELAQTAGQQLSILDIPSVVILRHPVNMHTLSLAMAATYCLSNDDQRAQIAFREAKHGLHPTMLSTHQAIQRMGPASAMRYLLSGEALSPAQALQLGLLDACVAETELQKNAIKLLNNKPSKPRAGFAQHLRTLSPFRKTLNFDLHDKVRSIGKQADYPAPHALLRLWEQHGLDSSADTQQAYADSIKNLSQTQQAANLSRMTRLMEHLRHLDDDQPGTIKHIYLIGFGAEACNIATCLLLKGIYVTMSGKHGDMAEQARSRIEQLLIASNSTGQLQNASEQRMLNRLSHDKTGTAVGDADLILVADELTLADSQELYAELEETARSDAILAIHPNTLTLDNIAAAMLNPQRLLGMHFCLPPVSTGMPPLVELALGQHTNRQLLHKVQVFLRQTGHITMRTPGRPGQLVRRLLLHYVLQGIRLHQQGVPHAYIDRAGQNCGMGEGPLEMADRLGLDDCLRLAEALQKAKHNVEIPYSLHDKVKAGNLGIKSGSGFYRYRNGNRLKTERVQWNGSEQALQEKLVGQICEEAATCLEEGLLDSPDLIDAGIIFGAGFAPYPGGPLYQQRML